MLNSCLVSSSSLNLYILCRVESGPSSSHSLPADSSILFVFTSSILLLLFTNDSHLPYLGLNTINGPSCPRPSPFSPSQHRYRQ